MLKEHDTLFRQLMIITDLVIVAIAFFVSYQLRTFMSSTFIFQSLYQIYPVQVYLNLLPFILVLWAGALHFVGAYQPLRGRKLSEVALDIIAAGLLVTVLFGGTAYLLKIQHVSRILTALIVVLSTLFLSVERIMQVQILQFIRRKGYNYRYVLIVGTGKRAQKLMAIFQQHPEWGLRIAGLVDEDPGLKGKVVHGNKVIGTFQDMPKILEEMVIDEVVFIVPRSSLGKIEEPILYCEQIGKRVSIAVDLFSMNFAKAIQSSLQGFPLLMFQSTSDKLWQLLIKRLLDVIISSLAIIILLPFFIIISILIKTNSEGPILFTQTRCSLNGRVFTLYKFRTMVINAEALMESLRQHNEMKGPAFKMSNDPRIIKFGKWMRKFSIDEFPQLVNVLKGDMSIVGPRPPIPAEVRKYAPWQRRRLSMRPGLTCLWQIKGRNKVVDFEEWMRLDLEYIDNWSLYLDLKIFLRTIPVVLFGIGAK